MKKQYLVEEKRWLVYLFAFKSPWWALSLTLPLISLWLFLWLQSDQAVISSLLGFGLGLLVWMVFEYALHRYIYHFIPKTNSLASRFLKSFHIYHHNKPEDRGVITAGIIPVLFFGVLIGFPLWLALPSLSSLAACMLGITLYHHYYEWVHYLVHQKEHTSGRLKYLQQYHLRHHKKWNVNYGQTTSLIDRLMGTYEEISADSVVSWQHIFKNLKQSISYSGRLLSHD